MTNSALIAKLRYNANTEYSTPRNPPSISPNFTSPKPMLSFFRINCPMRPILKRKPAKTNDPDMDSSQFIDRKFPNRPKNKTDRPNIINPLGIMKWSMSTNVTAISK